jgi:N-acetylglucosamine-6-phosphate deacetylase
VQTFITAEEERLVDALHLVPLSSATGPRILGVHLEGPFLSAARIGAHPVELRRDPDVGLAARLLEAGPVALMTIAPELPGAAELVTFLHGRGVVVSCGHSDATAAEAHRLFDQGVATVTHLFNAMRPLGHRDPGIVGAALARPDVVVQVIVDGVHLAPEVVQVVWRAAAGRVALVTDAVAPAGSDGNGSYRLGDVEVVVRDGAVRRADDGVLAGSVLSMIEAVRNLHALGAPLERALEAASSVPARVLGANGIGRIERGAAADIVVLDDDLQIERVLVGGNTRVAA